MMNKHETTFDHPFTGRPEKPPIIFEGYRPRPLRCIECPSEFTATAPSQKRCAACQALAAARSTKRGSDKAQVKRKAARVAAKASSS